MLLRDGRTEHVERAHLRRVQHAEGDDDHPQPRPRPELVPALDELADERRRLPTRARRKVDARQEERCEDIARGVDRKTPGRPDSGDDDARHRRTENRRRVPRQPQEHVRFLQPPRAHDLRDDALRRREEERGADAADGLDRDQLPELRVAADDHDREETLRRAGDEVGDDENRVPRQPVSDYAPDEDEHDRGEHAGGEDEPEIRGGPDLKHRESDRDRGERAPEERHEPPQEEQAELPLGERAECCAEPHRRSLGVAPVYTARGTTARPRSGVVAADDARPRVSPTPVRRDRRRDLRALPTRAVVVALLARPRRRARDGARRPLPLAREAPPRNGEGRDRHDDTWREPARPARAVGGARQRALSEAPCRADVGAERVHDRPLAAADGDRRVDRPPRASERARARGGARARARPRREPRLAGHDGRQPPAHARRLARGRAVLGNADLARRLAARTPAVGGSARC